MEGTLPELEGTPVKASHYWGLEHHRTIVFLAHPDLHRYPWSVPETVANDAFCTALTCQVFQIHKRLLRPALQVWLRGFDSRASTDRWKSNASDQRPSHVWKHANGLTEYHVWTCYRVATKQLTLYHAERTLDNSCRKLPQFQGNPETAAQIFRNCPAAQGCWRQLIGCWTGELAPSFVLSNFMSHCVIRQAPPIPRRLVQRLHDRFLDDFDNACANLTAFSSFSTPSA